MTNYIEYFNDVFNTALTDRALKFHTAFGKTSIRGEWTARKERNQVIKAMKVAGIEPKDYGDIAESMNKANESLRQAFMSAARSDSAYQYVANFMCGICGTIDTIKSISQGE